MGVLKRAMLARDDEFGRFLQEVLDDGGIVGPAAGITRKVIADGSPEELSDKQYQVFDTFVLDKYVKPCTVCGNDLPSSELSAARGNGGKCSWCWNRESKKD